MNRADPIAWADAHVHVVDFLQRRGDVGDLVEAMLGSGVTHAVVFGIPVKKRWATSEPLAPGYYLDDNAPCHYHSLTDVITLDVLQQCDGRVRMAPLICGFDPTDLMVREHLDAMWERSRAWAGVGEVMLRHDDLTNLTDGETPVADHPAMDEVADFCRDTDVPVTVHHDSSSPGRPDAHEFVPEFERLLGRHPRTRVVWAHAGVSRRVESTEQIRVVDDLLSRHTELYVDLSWTVLDHIVDRDGPGAAVDSRWLELICRRADRFVVGSDTVGRADMFEARVGRIRSLLRTLPQTVAKAVAVDNASALWFRPGS